MGSGMALNVAKAGFPLAVYDAQEGRTQELRESWVKDKHLPTGWRGYLFGSGRCGTFCGSRDVCLDKRLLLVPDLP